MYEFLSTDFAPEYQTSEVDRGQIAWWEDGSGPKTVVWLHGLPLDSRSWEAQRRHFSPLARNIFIDLRGYGRSSKLPADTTDVTQLYCDDIAAVFRTLQLTETMLVGFASAGHVALRFCALHPGLVSKLVTINGSPRFRKGDDWPWGFSPEGIEHFTKPLDEHGIEGITDAVLEPGHVFRDVPRTQGERLAEWFRPMSLNAGADTLRGFFYGISLDDDRHLLKDIKASTLLISGTIGQEVPPNVGLYMRQSIANSRLVELPGVDHFAFATRPDLINALIEDHLADGPQH